MIKGKLAEVLGVLEPGPCMVNPFVLGMVTMLAQEAVPVQVRFITSPLFAAAIAALTAVSEQSEGPTVTIAPGAATGISSKKPRTRTNVRAMGISLAVALWMPTVKPAWNSGGIFKQGGHEHCLTFIFGNNGAQKNPLSA